jgi:hypothetical protein
VEYIVAPEALSPEPARQRRQLILAAALGLVISVIDQTIGFPTRFSVVRARHLLNSPLLPFAPISNVNRDQLHQMTEEAMYICDMFPDYRGGSTTTFHRLSQETIEYPPE